VVERCTLALLALWNSTAVQLVVSVLGEGLEREAFAADDNELQNMIALCKYIQFI
jgi:hypothetical protein